jgi:hypothetical protein
MALALLQGLFFGRSLPFCATWVRSSGGTGGRSASFRMLNDYMAGSAPDRIKRLPISAPKHPILASSRDFCHGC